jgi:tetratricopeptide (TPR) repeat protein
MKKTFFLVFLMSLTIAVAATTEFNRNCREAYSEILCLRFRDARKLIADEKTINPSNSLPYLLDNYTEFLTVMIGEEEKDLEIMRKNLDARLERLKKGDPASPWFLYSQAEVYFQWGFARLKFSEYLSAGIDINKAFRLFEENDRKFPFFIPNKIRLGLLHALVGAVPDKYNWAVTALDFKGTIPQGIQELNHAYTACLSNTSYDFLLPEVTFTLAMVYMNMSSNKDAVTKLASEFDKPPLSGYLKKSPLLCYTLANMKMRLGKNDEAISLLTASPRAAGSYPVAYLDYLLGVAKLNRQDSDAYMPFMKFVAEFKGRNYIRSAYEHLAWYHLLHANTEKYWFYMDRIKLRGYSMVDNDKQAMKNAKKREMPNPMLLKAKLSFDGGYFNKALEDLSIFSNSKGMENPRLQLEYTYRKARTYDELGKHDEAISWYNRTISLGEKDPAYFAANSALYLGKIYENEGKYELASACYAKCLKMDFDEFHFSITQKAKSGLNRIKNRQEPRR